MSQQTLTEVPEIFVGVNRPPIDQFEKTVRAVTPGSWVYKGIIWEHTQPPEFDVNVEPASCGDHTRHFDGGHYVSWNMEITACVEDRRTTQAEGGVEIPGITVFEVKPMNGLWTHVRDADGNQQRVPIHAVSFARHEDAEFFRTARSMLNETLRYVRGVEMYASSKTREVTQLQDDKTALEAEVARLKALINGDD